MQYFAQDEARELDPTLTVYQTLAGDAPIHMVPHIRNILGGFLFSGDDIDKPVRVLSGGERTRLAVARMLLRPANTLLLDEPTNHLDLDSKDVLLEALEDFGGTLIFVSHDRYFRRQAGHAR
jgi:ATP-binding cassette subfamily F protein 3